jgi:hypothetical protein
MVTQRLNEREEIPGSDLRIGLYKAFIPFAEAVDLECIAEDLDGRAAMIAVLKQDANQYETFPDEVSSFHNLQSEVAPVLNDEQRKVIENNNVRLWYGQGIRQRIAVSFHRKEAHEWWILMTESWWRSNGGCQC